MWQLSSKFLFALFFLLISLPSFSKSDTIAYSPVFRDSILKNKMDSAQWNKLLTAVDINKTNGKHIFIQKQKQPDKSSVFFLFSLVILLLLLLLRLIFDDFFFSLLEGIISIKKFFIFYKSKKYDSLLAVIFIYILKISILSLVVYIGLCFYQKDNFSIFRYYFFFDIWILLGLFFTVKNIIEFIFNSVINTQETFKAFFLQNLFAEFLWSTILLFLFLMCIYNNNIPPNLLLFLILFSFSVYTVFNIVRSYQLMGNIRIPYKLHFFLYICAFKIIPLLLLAKYILNNVVD